MLTALVLWPFSSVAFALFCGAVIANRDTQIPTDIKELLK